VAYRLLVQKNLSAETKTAVSGSVTNEDTVRSDGVNIPSSFVLQNKWVIDGTISLSGTIGAAALVEDTDYTVSVLGNDTIIDPLTVWDAGDETANAATYNYFRTHLLSPNIMSTHKDLDYFYVAQDFGLSVFNRTTLDLYGWIEREGGFTCIHTEGNNVWLGTDDDGIYHLYRTSLAGSTTASSVFSTTTTPTGIQNDNIRQIDHSNNVLAVATAGSVEVIHNPLPAISSGTVYYRGENTYSVYITTNHLYWSPASTSYTLRYKTPVPTANWADSNHDFSTSTTPSATSNLTNIRAIDVTRGTSSYGGDTVFIGLQNAGVDIISINDSNPSGGDIRNVSSRKYAYAFVSMDDGNDDDFYIRNKVTGVSFATYNGGTAEDNGYIIASDGHLWIAYEHTGTGNNLVMRRIRLSDGVNVQNVYSHGNYIRGCIALTEDKDGNAYFISNQTNNSGYYSAVCLVRSGNTFTYQAHQNFSTSSSYRGIAIYARPDGKIVTVCSTYFRIWNSKLASAHSGWVIEGANANYAQIIDLENSIYFCDTSLTRIYKYDKDGVQVTFSSFTNQPRSLCMDIEGMIWVGHENGVISRFDPYNGAFGTFFFKEKATAHSSDITYITCVPDDPQRGNFAIWTLDAGQEHRKYDKNGNQIASIALGAGWNVNVEQNGKDPSGINHQMINRRGVGFAEAFAGRSDNVAAVKAHPRASKDTYMMHVATSAYSEEYHEGSYSQYRLDTDELESFVEFKQSTDVEVL
jgi:hypothetical protein